MIAKSSPKLAWLGPAAPVAQAVRGRGTTSPATYAAAAPDADELDVLSRDVATMSRDLSALRQSIDQLAAGQRQMQLQMQQQMTRDVTRLPGSRQDMSMDNSVPVSTGPATMIGTMPTVVNPPVRRPPPVVQVPAIPVQVPAIPVR